jgi:hypothetical protein
MSFAAPIAFILAALAAPIVVFYVLKVRLRRVPVSTNLFWKQIYDEKPPRSIWQHLRHLLSLLLQLLMIVLLVLAATDPYFPWQLLHARRIVVVIDNSASMRAADVEPTRLAAALESAESLVEGLRFRDELAIVLAEPRPKVVVGMSGHIPTLKRALQAIAPSDNPTELATAIELGKQLIGDHPQGQVVVFTDGCGDEPSEQLAESRGEQDAGSTQDRESAAETGRIDSPVIEFRYFGTEAANVGITQFQVRRSLIDPLGYEVLLAVRNAGPLAVQCRVELELAGHPVDVLPLSLKPEESWSRSLEKTSLEGGRLSARLTQIEPADAAASPPSDASTSRSLNALATDDTGWAVLPPREIQQVLIVTPGNLFLQKVFEANPLVRVEARKDFPEQWPADALIVLHRDVPEKLPAGNVFVVDPAGSCDAWKLGELLENPIITEQDKESPLMTHVRLDNVVMPEAKRLEFVTPPHVLAGALADGIVYAEVKRPAGKCLVLTVNLDQGDLAFRTAFPIMVTNALGWFAGQSGELRESISTGNISHAELDDAMVSAQAGLVLRSPAGRETPVARRPTATDSSPDDPQAARSADSSVLLGPFDECGIWTVRRSDRADDLPLTEFALNLTNARESDLRPPAERMNENRPDPLLAGWLVRPLWFYLLALACALTIAEWLLYQRRFIT